MKGTSEDISLPQFDGFATDVAADREEQSHSWKKQH